MTFEYSWFDLMGPLSSIDDLNELGADGWRAVTAIGTLLLLMRIHTED